MSQDFHNSILKEGQRRLHNILTSLKAITFCWLTLLITFISSWNLYSALVVWDKSLQLHGPNRPHLIRFHSRV
ncbi:hypothetical protein Pr1d_23900 [Bythopirellula goksoeyrii]|uniref:Uncharacterized protein n=1 Tax=Bythopirellula goksoeyrii TaxID=1400387 RepID=A0A5B9QBF0_9BACT|nr:hypothetical protein Pr1d_23900 [Bythopirellula goksoeyrii]